MDRYTDLDQRRAAIEAQIRQHLCSAPIERGHAAREYTLAELYLEVAENLRKVENATYGDRDLHPSFPHIVAMARQHAALLAVRHDAAGDEWDALERGVVA